MMTENLLDSGLGQAPQVPGFQAPGSQAPGLQAPRVQAQARPAAAGRGWSPAPAVATVDRSPRPAGLPDKFWDDAKGAVRLDALVKSYLELERKLGTLGNGQRGVPPSPDQYALAVNNVLLTPDAEINKRLHAAGFTQEQAQLVYDLANERMMPLITELASVFEAESQIERLTQHFGGEDRWREVARQIDAWAKAKLPPRVYDALSTTYEGVLAMYRMMDGQEPGLLRDGSADQAPVTDASLRQLMRDPRYWKQQDPVVVQQVRDGFRRLYNGQG